MEELFAGLPLVLLLSIPFIMIWDLIWKGMGMWRSAQNEHAGWFIAILVFNTVGILPIIYLIFFSDKRPIKLEDMKPPAAK